MKISEKKVQVSHWIMFAKHVYKFVCLFGIDVIAYSAGRLWLSSNIANEFSSKQFIDFGLSKLRALPLGVAGRT